MDPSDPVATFRALAVKRNVSIGVLASARPAEFRIALAAASLAIAGDRPSTEREVNAALSDWLAGAGAMLAVDHVELRRWLVDTGLVTRDGYGRAYARAVPSNEYAAVVEALRRADPVGLAADARAQLAQSRARRRAEYERRQGDGP